MPDTDPKAKEENMAILRTYFWALEAYKLFEESLTKTVEAWELFSQLSLDRVNDGRDDEGYRTSVELIELSVDRLREKISWVKKKSEQVHRMREGLGFVASMCDTSATLRQNENIKLLTCFSILFLPLSLSAVSHPLPPSRHLFLVCHGTSG